MKSKYKKVCLYCKSNLYTNTQVHTGYCTECGSLYVENNDLSELPENIFNKIKEKADSGNIYYSFLMGRMYFFENDYKNAFAYLINATKEEYIPDAFAMYAVAYIRSRENATKNNYKSALYMVEKAEELGSVFLQKNGFNEGEMTFKEALIHLSKNDDISSTTNPRSSHPIETSCYYYLNGECTRSEPYHKCNGYCGYYK